MSRRWWLLAAALVVIGISVAGWVFFTPRGWQVGGVGIMPTPSYVGLVIGLVLLVLSLPRRVRLGVSLTLVAGASLFLGLWPSWEGRAFPNAIYLDELASTIVTERDLSLCIYTIDGPLWTTAGRTAAEGSPYEGRIDGFYAGQLPLRARLSLMSLGFRLRPVWPGSVRTSY